MSTGKTMQAIKAGHTHLYTVMSATGQSAKSVKNDLLALSKHYGYIQRVGSHHERPSGRPVSVYAPTEAGLEWDCKRHTRGPTIREPRSIVNKTAVIADAETIVSSALSSRHALACVWAGAA